MIPRFIVDVNVGKLAKWLRILGYDTLFINSLADDELIRIAISEGRVLLTRDIRILRRRVVYSGKLKLVLIRDDDIRGQLRQVIGTLGLSRDIKPFSRCPECNEPLFSRSSEQVRDLVPPYVFKTQTQYMECPSCHRIYWRGTHWQRMKEEVEKLLSGQSA
jgi:hypothetical protein